MRIARIVEAVLPVLCSPQALCMLSGFTVLLRHTDCFYLLSVGRISVHEYLLGHCRQHRAVMVLGVDQARFLNFF